MTERKYSIDSGWIVSTTDDCTCGMGRYSSYGHEAFCGLEQEAPVEEFDGWVKHMLAKTRKDEQDRHHKDQCCRVCDTHTMPHRGCILR